MSQKIKQLEWTEYGDGTGGCTAEHPFGEYILEADDCGDPIGVWTSCEDCGPDEPELGYHPNATVAKAVAQADFERRIRSTFEET